MYWFIQQISIEWLLWARLCFRTWNTEMNKRHKNHIGLLGATKRSKVEGSKVGGACNFKQWSRKESQKRHPNKEKGDKGVSHVDICGKTIPGRRNKGFEWGMFWPTARTAKRLCGWGRVARGGWRWWLPKGMEERRWSGGRGHTVGHFKDLGFYSEQMINLRQKSLKEFEIWSTSVNLSEVSDSISPTQSQVTWQAEGTLSLPYVIKHCLFQRMLTGKISAVWIANK